MGVLQTAEFSTLAPIFAGLVCLKPLQRGSTGNKIPLALKTRRPKTMNDIV
jgi:hypothetical protein